MEVVIFGGGNVGEHIVNILYSKGIKITVIEKKEERCDELAENYDIDVINEDATNLEILESINWKNIWAVFAVTGLDEVNILVSLYAKEQNIGKILCRINDSRYSKLLRRFNIYTIARDETLAENLVNLALNPTAYKLFQPEQSNLLIEEHEGKRWAGKKIKEILKDNFNIIAIHRDSQFFLPNPEFVIHEKDIIISIRKGKL